MFTDSKLTRIGDPAVEPISLDEAKQYCRVEIDDDDGLIGDLITAARLEVEARHNTSLLTTDWQYTLDHFPPGGQQFQSVLPAIAFGSGYLGTQWRGLAEFAVRLPMGPVNAVQAIEYVDGSGVVRNLPLSAVSMSGGMPCEITPAFGRVWPLTLPVKGAVNIYYTAGYGLNATDVPANLRAAIKLLVAHYYEHRTDDAAEPAAIDRLINATAVRGYR